VNGDGNANRRLLQEARRGSAQARIELVGGKARYHLIQYGFHRADAVVAPAENGRSLLIIQSDALTEALLDGVDFRAQRLQRIDRQV
jgi:hypothetical protein